MTISPKERAEQLMTFLKDTARSLDMDEKWICCMFCQQIIEETSLRKEDNPFTEYWRNVQLEIQKL